MLALTARKEQGLAPGCGVTPSSAGAGAGGRGRACAAVTHGWGAGGGSPGSGKERAAHGKCVLQFGLAVGHLTAALCPSPLYTRPTTLYVQLREPSPPGAGAGGAVLGAGAACATSPPSGIRALEGTGWGRATSRDRGEALTAAVVLPAVAPCSGMMVPSLHRVCVDGGCGGGAVLSGHLAHCVAGCCRVPARAVDARTGPLAATLSLAAQPIAPSSNLSVMLMPTTGTHRSAPCRHHRGRPALLLLRGGAKLGGTMTGWGRRASVWGWVLGLGLGDWGAPTGGSGETAC